MSSMPILQKKQYHIEVFTKHFKISGIIEPTGALYAYINGADHKNLKIVNANAVALDPSIVATSFTAEELWVHRSELTLVNYLDPISNQTLPLLPVKEKLRIFLPNLVVQATVSHGQDTRINDIFEAGTSELITATEARIFPIVATKIPFSRDATTIMISRHHVQFYQPIEKQEIK
jgi:hypothetical protein